MQSNFVYYQPNDKDIKDEYGDCTIRALSKALNCSWLEAFDKTIPFCRKYQLSNIFDGDLAVRIEILKELGFEYVGVSNKKGTKRPTIAEFSRQHKDGIYLLVTAHHITAALGGKYFDTWDSGDKSMYGYFKKVV